MIAEPLDDRKHLRWRAADVDADARMLFARVLGGELTTVALVDATTLRSARYPGAERSYPSRVSELYFDLSHDDQRRKAS